VTGAIPASSSSAPRSPRLGRRLTCRALSLLACLAALLTASACDKIPLTAPSGSEVSVTSNLTTIALNGSVELTAMVIEAGGTPVNDGTVVSFTTTIGTFDRNDVQTDDGRARVNLRVGNTSGTAVVRAISGGATSGPLELTVGAAAVANIILTANPSSVSSSQGGNVVLQATVVDEGNNPVPGVAVNFTASAGTLTLSRVNTDNNGVATTILNTNRQTTVRASIGAIQSNEVTIVANTAPRVTVNAAPSTAAENVPITFTTTVTTDNNTAIRNGTINFGDGTSQSIGTALSTPLTHSYRSAGTYVVTATVTDVNGEVGTGSAAVVITPAPSLLATLAVSPNPTRVDQLTTFTVTLTNSALTPNISRVEYDFGDGNPPQNGSTTTTHIYRRVQEATAKVTIFLNDGRSTTTTAQVVVNP
jgi:protocatechuate 3,4-dioxygenase beta subunit